ncbi:microtubule cross-linking factor 1-like isoform X2 [Megalops cyprinoides]|uniref:microtubule cross-linking factor 1-like isoform X2 n=1 Tax=Megalops cyprinoides TaxID=118141 RepID=UPI001864E44C|nr:microtubule cross-linking factor 1-like isoform X2 [Megalops cyprinoides]
MESANGSNGEIKQQNHQLEKKRVNRAPSPARPVLKDIHSRASAKPPGIAPKSPKLSSKQQQPSAGLQAAQSRVSRRNVSGAKERPTPAKSNAKSVTTKKPAKVTQNATSEQKVACKQVDASQNATKGKKGKIPCVAESTHGSPLCVPTDACLGRVNHTDSSSDLSDCPSEPLSDEQRCAQAASSDAESGTGSGSSDRDQLVGGDNSLQGASSLEPTGGTHPLPRIVEPCAMSSAKESVPRGLLTQGHCSTEEPLGKSKPDPKLGKSSAPAHHILKGNKDVNEEDLLREIEDLRSENDYLKDEVEELRAEMEEVRDSYLEEEVYQLQELRRELDRANKNCRILQYRLRKAEQKSLKVAQTGQVDGELVRSLEQDLKVAKDVSVRLHNELESVEDKRTRAEDENELLRQKIIEVEISRQALHNEIERLKESSTKRRVGREIHKEKKSTTQEDSADLRCQLQFAKEESALMRKKMAKLGREKDELEQELQKYKCMYGDVDSAVPTGECGGPPSTREAELKLRLKLVEEEANILGRKIVELEVENRGLRAENEDIRCQYEKDCLGREPLSSVPTSPYGDGLESAAELRRHLQFVEEEAELLRRSISEIEDHNKQLTTELNRFKFGPGQETGWAQEDGSARPGGGNGNSNGGGCCLSPGAGPLQEELKAARQQINELSGKVLKLQYENRVLLSNVQRYDLASHLGLQAAGFREGDAESDGGKKEGEGEEAGCPPPPQPRREGPVGGESDSEDHFERTSGLGSRRPSEVSGFYSAELAWPKKEDAETFVNVKREAERLGKTVDRLITDTDSLIYDGKLLVTGGEPLTEEVRGSGDACEGKAESQVLDAINTRMKAFRTELRVFMEKVDHLGEGLGEHVEDLSPMPNLTESTSFLSGVTSMSHDSPVTPLRRDLMTDFQSGLRDEPEWRLGQDHAVEPETQRGHQGTDQGRGADGHSKYSRPEGLSVELRDAPLPEVSGLAREVQAQLEQRRQRQEEHRGHSGCVVQEQAWPQERALLQQEMRLFRHSTFLLYVKLRWLLRHWRQRLGADEGEEDGLPEYERLDSTGLGCPELGLLMEQVEGDREDRPCFQHSAGASPDQGALPQSPEPLQHQRQVSETRRVLQGLRVLLEEFRLELRDEEQRRSQLQQTYANEKAAWEVQWAELKSKAQQLEPSGDPKWDDLKEAIRREREEHQRLLAENHSATLDLHWKLQHGERRWSRERTELLERFERERQDWDWQMRELHHSIEKLQREGKIRAPLELKEEDCGALSPQSSPRAVECPRSPRASAPAPVRSLSDSEAPLDDQPAMMRLKASESFRATENLFLDALSLDPLSDSNVLPPSRLESEKRFPCLNEALNEISDQKGPLTYHDEEIRSGSLLRAKSVCSMSEFQRLMDSSPYLPEKGMHGSSGRDEVTPPLSPDDLKYIEEFNSKRWDFPSPSGPPEALREAWAERPEGRRAEQTSEPFQPDSWYLTTSATITTNTLSSPEHCQKQAPGSSVGADHYGVRVFRSPSRNCKIDSSGLPLGDGGPAVEPELMFSLTKAKGGSTKGGADEVFGGWPRELPKNHKELLDGGPRLIEPSICPTVGFSSSLHGLQLSRNLSDDMKEVAFSVRNAIRSTPVERHFKDTACQTNSFTTRGTQTTQTISVGLQTEALRNLTSSPHKCLTPKGGSTPISSPSRNMRKMPFSPVVQSKFERQCCSPKYGSPKLQRRIPSKADLSGGKAAPPAPPQKGHSESAWARSTTTRDSPVHTTINDGLSSLFNIIDHTPLAHDALPKFARSPSRCHPTEARPAENRLPGLSVAQEFSKNVGGRPPSPVQLIVETQGEKTPEVVSIRQDLSAPPGYNLAENAARILNKRLSEQTFRDEKRLPSVSQASFSKDGRVSEGDKPLQGSIEVPQGKHPK